MANVLSLADARDYTNFPVHRVTDKKLTLMIGAASSMINTYLASVDIEDDDTPLLEMVCVELILYLNRDKSLSMQQFEDAKEQLNMKAIEMILAKLDGIKYRGSNDTDNPKQVKVRFL